jgi:hypothetical protein
MRKRRLCFRARAGFPERGTHVVTFATGLMASATVSTRRFAAFLLIALACADVARGQEPLNPADATIRPAWRRSARRF